jgi:hypothetical protein
MLAAQEYCTEAGYVLTIRGRGRGEHRKLGAQQPLQCGWRR